MRSWRFNWKLLSLHGSVVVVVNVAVVVVCVVIVDAVGVVTVDTVVVEEVVGHVPHLAGQAAATDICRNGSKIAPLVQSAKENPVQGCGSNRLSHRGPAVHTPHAMRHKLRLVNTAHVAVLASVTQSGSSKSCIPFRVHRSNVPVVVEVVVVVVVVVGAIVGADVGAAVPQVVVRMKRPESNSCAPSTTT